MSSDVVEVHLYIYDLTRGMARMMSAAFLGRHIDGVWHTGVVAYGREFFFGSMGIQSCPPGSTVLGPPDQVHSLGRTEIPYSVFSDYVTGLSDSTFRPTAYDLLQHNCNNFSNELALFLCGAGIPQHILDLPSEVLNTPLGQSLQPLLLSLSSQAVDPVTSASVGVAPRLRQSSPDSVALEAAIEQARRDSLKLEERRDKILHKVEKLEKKKVKNQQQKSVKMADNDVASSAAALENSPDEETRPPREPPVIFRDHIHVMEEFENLCQLLKPVADDADRTSVDELGQYMIADEGSWVLGDGFLGFISKYISESAPAEIRLKLLRVLAAAALKDDVILILHQDRRDHVIMNYAQTIDRLPLAEQEAVALLICNLFENSSSAEWLLYISEWNNPSVSTQPLSNIRVTTKVAVTALLSDSASLQNYGSAIIHNLAIKEKMERNKDLSEMMPKGSLTKVFDDVATELAMAILQFFSGEHCEEHIFRCMKGLLRFAYISHSEVPALIKMIGPDPTQFRGMSERIDSLIEPLSDRLRSARGFD